jgi:hypothetical protein
MKPSNEIGNPSRTKSGSSSSIITKKKIYNSSTPTKQSVDSKPKSIPTVTKITDVKSKTTLNSSKTVAKITTGSSKTVAKITMGSSKTVAKTTTKVREKKIYTLPGQKHDPPEEREPLRIFYESLSKQIPTSEMAQFWLMEHGLLPADKAKRAYERKQVRQKQIRMGTPIKPQKPFSKPESSHKQQQPSKNGEIKSNKRIKNESDDDDEFIMSPKRRRV